MYCTNCDCEFDGWKGNCPNCKNKLHEVKPLPKNEDFEHLEYDTIVQILKENGGSLDIPIIASEVGKTKSLRFPYAGFGYAWTKMMHGSWDGIGVDLSTTKVGKDRKRGFPYLGHGYAWQQEMEGFIGGHDVSLVAKKVTKKKSWGFPYRGFGYAWTEEMAGDLGGQIKITMKPSQVKKKRGWQFPYFGFGYAWVNEGELTLSLT